jgi:hypothetical protein
MIKASCRKIQINAPGIAALDARLSLTSISHRPTPLHLVLSSSVGHIKGLMKLKVLSKVIQKTRTAAARLRDSRCVTRGGRQSTIESPASVGRSIEERDLGAAKSWVVY